ncbi:MAG TPA: hypothetical protein VJ953_05585 [Saprospiraceae bacterium]|nr:hypothetical protein [Saprospiraceae bacterium]
MPIKQILALAFAVASGFTMVLFTHSMIKLPSEPFWSTPQSIYENYALAMALAFSVPYPMWTSAGILLLMMLLVYWIWRKILRF